MRVAVREESASRMMQAGAWTLAAIVILFAVAAWSQVRLTEKPLSAYDIFPLFGLMAFSLMWTHYVTGAIRRLMHMNSRTLRRYFQVTSGLVLVLLLLHPGIFLAMLWLDGFGLPPFSYWEVYAGLFERFALLLGTISLFVFLGFEFYRKYKAATWWRYVEYANMAAMGAIFYHALTLGGELELGWFRLVWFVYGATFVAAVIIRFLMKGKRRI